MNIEYARNVWIPRLRSGQYLQGNGFLHAGDKWCCLGVGVDGRHAWQVEQFSTIPVYCYREYSEELGFETLHDALLSEEDKVFLFGTADPDGMQRLCTTMNDQENMSFEQIADVLEQLCDEPETLRLYNKPHCYYTFMQREDGRTMIDVIWEQPETSHPDFSRDEYLSSVAGRYAKDTLKEKPE